MNIEEIVETAFEEFIAEFELDPEDSINDLLFELYAAGFEAAIEVMSEEEEEDEQEE